MSSFEDSLISNFVIGVSPHVRSDFLDLQKESFNRFHESKHVPFEYFDVMEAVPDGNCQIYSIFHHIKSKGGLICKVLHDSFRNLNTKDNVKN